MATGQFFVYLTSPWIDYKPTRRHFSVRKRLSFDGSTLVTAITIIFRELEVFFIPDKTSEQGTIIDSSLVKLSLDRLNRPTNLLRNEHVT